jgi:hypothetical protein
LLEDLVVGEACLGELRDVAIGHRVRAVSHLLQIVARRLRLRPAGLCAFAQPFDLVLVTRRDGSTLSLREGVDAVNRILHPIGANYLVIAAVFGLCAAAVYAGVAMSSDAAPKGRQHVSAAERPPSAAEFAADFAGVTNHHGLLTGVTRRIGRVHCVQASRGRYMCSYAVADVGSRSTCHLMQARWTPHTTSSFHVTLAGRTERCQTLRDALTSLR